MLRRASVGLALLLAPVAAWAQSPIAGRLVEASSERPMACWRVSLVDGAGITRDSAVTDRDGAFHFATTDGVPLRLLAQQPGLMDFLAELGRPNSRAQSQNTFRVRLLPDSARRIARRGRSASAPLEGIVHYTFVVDTLGRVDPSSAFLVSASSPALARRVERGLASMQFEPWTPTPSQSCLRVVQPFVFGRGP